MQDHLSTEADAVVRVPRVRDGTWDGDGRYGMGPWAGGGWEDAKSRAAMRGHVGNGPRFHGTRLPHPGEAAREHFEFLGSWGSPQRSPTPGPSAVAHNAIVPVARKLLGPRVEVQRRVGGECGKRTSSTAIGEARVGAEMGGEGQARSVRTLGRRRPGEPDGLEVAAQERDCSWRESLRDWAEWPHGLVCPRGRDGEDTVAITTYKGLVTQGNGIGSNGAT
ncbi:hypothetical protein ColTof3_00835 [Colletotrichum tofieldiae]|nr:hypothetical protein ColTof3_00835 [Colletotrichum tofieldiae]